MRLVREGRVEDDAFVHVGDDVELVPPGDVIVSLARWERERAQLVSRSGRLGVRIDGTVSLDRLSPDLPCFAVVAIEFRPFADGRGYSVARLLRERHGYRGELRAIGNVLRDQLLYLRRCGFDAFEIDPKKKPEDALAALQEMSVFYQAAADLPLPLWKRVARA